MFNKFIFYKLSKPNSAFFEEEAPIDLEKNKNNFCSYDLGS